MYKRQGLQGRLRVGVIPFLSRQTHDSLWQYLLALRPRMAVSYTHLRAHETVLDLVCRLLLEKKKN